MGLKLAINVSINILIINIQINRYTISHILKTREINVEILSVQYLFLYVIVWMLRRYFNGCLSMFLRVRNWSVMDVMHVMGGWCSFPCGIDTLQSHACLISVFYNFTGFLISLCILYMFLFSVFFFRRQYNNWFQDIRPW